MHPGVAIDAAPVWLCAPKTTFDVLRCWSGDRDRSETHSLLTGVLTIPEHPSSLWAEWSSRPWMQMRGCMDRISRRNPRAARAAFGVLAVGAALLLAACS